MIIGFCFPKFPDRGFAGSVHPPFTPGERGMKKIRGIVALCVALTMGLGSSALLAQKADPKKEVKRSKAEQIDFDTLVNVVDGGGAAPASEKFDFTTIGADGKLARYLQVKPGDYDVYVAIKDKGTVEKVDKNYTPRVALLKKDLSVPDYNKADLVTSSMLLSSGIGPAE